MTWRVIRETPARGDKPAQDSNAGMNIYSRETAELIVEKYREWGVDSKTKFRIEEETK